MNPARIALTLTLIACGPAVGQARSKPPEPLPEGGKVMQACVVNDSGDGVKNCVVESETPAGWGFGDAALTLSSKFKMGQGKVPVLPGSPIKIPVKFPKENRTASTVRSPSPPSPTPAR